MVIKKIFIDTNVLVRFFTEDDKEKFNDCLLLFKLIEAGNLKPYSSNIVIFELLHVLIKIYKFPKFEVLKDIQTLLNLRNITLIEKTDSKKALDLFKKFNVKYGDCLIAPQLPANSALITYDDDFKKITSIRSLTPKEITL